VTDVMVMDSLFVLLVLVIPSFVLALAHSGCPGKRNREVINMLTTNGVEFNAPFAMWTVASMS